MGGNFHPKLFSFHLLKIPSAHAKSLNIYTRPHTSLHYTYFIDNYIGYHIRMYPFPHLFAIGSIIVIVKKVYYIDTIYAFKFTIIMSCMGDKYRNTDPPPSPLPNFHPI